VTCFYCAAQSASKLNTLYNNRVCHACAKKKRDASYGKIDFKNLEKGPEVNIKKLGDVKDAEEVEMGMEMITMCAECGKNEAGDCCHHHT